MKGMTQQHVLKESSGGWSAPQELGEAQGVVCCLTKCNGDFNPTAISHVISAHHIRQMEPEGKLQQLPRKLGAGPGCC